MDITVGKTYPLRNLNTKETAPFTVWAMHSYKGCAVVYGETGAHSIRIYRGVRHVPGRPGFFVYLPNEGYENVLLLSQELRGLPLALLEEHIPLVIMQGSTQAVDIRAHPILNAGIIPGLGPPGVKTYDSMMMKGRQLVDLYHSWKRNGKLPRWIIQAKLRQQQN